MACLPWPSVLTVRSTLASSTSGGASAEIVRISIDIWSVRAVGQQSSRAISSCAVTRSLTISSPGGRTPSGD